DVVQVRFGLLGSCSRLQSTDAVQTRMITTLLPAWQIRQLARRHPHLDAARKGIRFRHDADDCVALAVESYRLVENTRLPAEAPLPQTLTQHDHRRAAGFVFVVREDASMQWIHTQ